MSKILVPVGNSDFTEIRQEKYYFIDKSGLIEELIKTKGTKVTLITRPRRFGKTLAMNMLASFFDLRRNSRELFDGLYVSENKEVCDNWMNQYPTLFLSFRSVDGLNFSKAYAMLAAVIADLYKEHFYLMQSPHLTDLDKEMFYEIASQKAGTATLGNSLLNLSRMLKKHYNRPVILLIDEYDVPLANSSEKGYYREMLDIIKDLMLAIKDNPALKLSVITGCLKIAKESIFTGTNNLVSDTISDTRLNEYFGFTQPEVTQLLHDTGLTSHEEEIKNWYDGYHFGNFNIYCPWDVMNHVNNLLLDETSRPKNFRENTSDNSIIRMFLSRTNFNVTEKFETLLAGGYIKEFITENLTYNLLESSEENLWSLLYLTGYLTRLRQEENYKLPDDSLLPEQYALTIPNTEVMDIYKKSVRLWLTESFTQRSRHELFTALWDNNSEKLTEIISDLLFTTISYHDYKENFYHAFITGLLSNAGFLVESNNESGLGRADIIIKDRPNRQAAIIEIKWTNTKNSLETQCYRALQQIEQMQYAKSMENEGFRKVLRFGMAFYRKECLVKTN